MLLPIHPNCGDPELRAGFPRERRYGRLEPTSGIVGLGSGYGAS
jgi:hypothetical protein